MSQADAVLEDDHGRTVLRFERFLGHPPEHVLAIPDRARRAAKLAPVPFELQPVVGGVVTSLRRTGPRWVTARSPSSIRPRALAYTWGEDLLRWEHHPRGEGCLLVLTHTFDDHLKAARDAAGWHLCLDGLAASLDGTEPTRGSDADGLPIDWTELNLAYQERFGIPADLATPRPG